MIGLAGSASDDRKPGRPSENSPFCCSFRAASAAQNPINHEPQHERDYRGSNNKSNLRWKTIKIADKISVEPEQLFAFFGPEIFLVLDDWHHGIAQPQIEPKTPVDDSRSAHARLLLLFRYPRDPHHLQF